jgi:phospholipid/cholesterol/gamma-HCH transport system substrate-binding protein
MGVLGFVFIALGANNRWFRNDTHFQTVLQTAQGLSLNMPVIYKGFKIGSLKRFDLDSNGDTVNVDFVIFDNYTQYARLGSIVEIQTSPIGLGNQFLFYPGSGTTLLQAETIIPARYSPEALALESRGLAHIPNTTDSISTLIANVGSIITLINDALSGTNKSTLGRSLAGIETNLTHLESVLANLETLTARLDSMSADVDKDIAPLYRSLTASLASVSGILGNLDKTSAFMPDAMPDVAAALSQARRSLSSAEDVLTALLNNPLLKGGVPPKAADTPDVQGPRAVEF